MRNEGSYPRYTEGDALQKHTYEWKESMENPRIGDIWTEDGQTEIVIRRGEINFLFELTYALSIAPSLNRTNNPTGEWELKYYGK